MVVLREVPGLWTIVAHLVQWVGLLILIGLVVLLLGLTLSASWWREGNWKTGRLSDHKGTKWAQVSGLFLVSVSVVALPVGFISAYGYHSDYSTGLVSVDGERYTASTDQLKQAITDRYSAKSVSIDTDTEYWTVYDTTAHKWSMTDSSGKKWEQCKLSLVDAVMKDVRVSGDSASNSASDSGASTQETSKELVATVKLECA